MPTQPTFLAVGSHPDDCDIKAGGIAAKYVELGRDVTFLSMTDGSAGHHEMGRAELARRRKRKAMAVEISEYGSRLTDEKRVSRFPF